MPKKNTLGPRWKAALLTFFFFFLNNQRTKRIEIFIQSLHCLDNVNGENYSSICEPNNEYSPLSFAETCKPKQRVIYFIRLLFVLTFVLKHIISNINAAEILGCFPGWDRVQCKVHQIHDGFCRFKTTDRSAEEQRGRNNKRSVLHERQDSSGWRGRTLSNEPSGHGPPGDNEQNMLDLSASILSLYLCIHPSIHFFLYFTEPFVATESNPQIPFKLFFCFSPYCLFFVDQVYWKWAHFQCAICKTWPELKEHQGQHITGVAESVTVVVVSAVEVKMRVEPEYFLILLCKLRIYYDQNGGNCGKTSRELSVNKAFFLWWVKSLS